MMKECLRFDDENPLQRPNPPADVQTVAEFLQGRVRPDLDDLQLDLVTTPDGVRSHWNFDAGTQFANEFLNRVHNAGFSADAFKSSDLNVQNIRDIFLRKIRYFMQLYRNIYFPVSRDRQKALKAMLRKTSRRLSVRLSSD